MGKILIISPSGNFYGSEQVLYDYLSHTAVTAEIAVPADSLFEIKLKTLPPGQYITAYQAAHIWRFYASLFFSLIKRKYRCIYLNEAGHVKYILLLSAIFKKVHFIVHVRIWEDTEKTRWITKPGKNVVVLSIAENIRSRLTFPSRILYDPFIFDEQKSSSRPYEKNTVLKIAIIGRITYTKGLYRLVEILEILEERNLSEQYQFILFGDVVAGVENETWFRKLKKFKQVSLPGFLGKAEIYNQVNVVMHLSMQEALGRIFLEAINEEMPFIGIEAAGIAEIGKLTGLEELLVNPDSPDLIRGIILNITKVKDNYTYYQQQVSKKKIIAQKIFDIKKYCDAMDGLLLT